MHTRRSFIATATLSVAASPHIGHAVTEMPASASWPEIQGPGADPQRTRFIKGRGIRTKPSNSLMNRPDLGFVQNTDVDPSMALTQGVVLARAIGPDFPLVAMDAASGMLLWERERTLKILGVSDQLGFIVTAPDADESVAVLNAVNVTGPTDLWAVEEHEIAGAVVIPGKALIYSRQNEDRVELVARDLASGKAKWTVDVTDEVDGIPKALSTDGNIVVNVSQTTSISTVMPAWDADTGELLWQNESMGYISSPTFHEGELVVATVEGVQLLDPTTGEVTNELDFPRYIGSLVKLIVTDDAVIVADSQHMQSIDWNSGAVTWSRAPRQAVSTREVYACDGMILRMEKATESSLRETALRGYSLHDGRLLLEYLPIAAEVKELGAAAFLVGSQQLFLATDKGLGTWFPTEEELDRPDDPMFDNTLSNSELGFTYLWDSNWEALGSTQMTPNGLLLEHADRDKYVAQRAGPTSESDRDFTSNWHAFFGPYDSSLVEVDPVEPPALDFLPDNAEVLAVSYRTTMSAPANECFGVRVLLPLNDGQSLVFEYLQYGMYFEEEIKSFATFFENLNIV